uniref:Paired amphipathic helix protein Sin3a n=1 Tax=Clastoptera arizonana TaxID=38151 RepID=A0A1B6C0M8_9HEMI
MKRQIEETDKSGQYSFNAVVNISNILSPGIPVPQTSYITNLKTTPELSSSSQNTKNLTTYPPTLSTIKLNTSTAPLSLQETSTLPIKKLKPAISPIAVHSSSNPQQMQRLKVDDALSYLDLVKYKFGEKPQIYNDFLDIMKEFKSQSIDTPGVIERVSTLFTGHPDLIVGFNTFLPPGYKIEIKSNDQGYSFQVQVSMPPTSPSLTSSNSIIQTNIGQQSANAINNTFIPQNSAIISPITVTASPPVLKTGSFKTIYTKPMHILEPILQSDQTETATQQPTSQNQPVEFNHAINYVNKIKNRFQGQPEKYKRFLEILHTYQMEQRTIKEDSGCTKQLTEAEVYSQVAKLFENQEDLLAEFGQFLPDAISHQTNLQSHKCDELLNISSKSYGSKITSLNINKNNLDNVNLSQLDKESIEDAEIISTSNLSSKDHSHVDTGHKGSTKRSFTAVPHPPHSPIKKMKSSLLKGITLSEASKYGTLSDFGFFDKVRKTINNTEAYENILRCLSLFNNKIISRVELIQLVTPYFAPYAELFKCFKEFLGENKGSPSHSADVSALPTQSCEGVYYDSLVNNTSRINRPGEKSLDIDYSTCKRIGASYCALPRNFVHPTCSGRSALCKEVLNDAWVSFSNWSEDSTFISSRKTQYEEYMHRCEDERFELDVILEINSATIRVFEGIHKKLSRMSVEEVNKFRLDDCLGGTSSTIHQVAIHKIYGEKGADIIEGLKKNPSIAVPIVLKRLKAKEEEWRDAQKGFNKIWREQNEKYYLKSLDHQGVFFKQNDVKYLRSKTLFNEIESSFDDRQEQAEKNNTSVIQGPHIVLYYKNKTVLDDATNLLIHHVKRQTNISKEDKQKIKKLLCQFLLDLFDHPRQELSEDEEENLKDKKSSSNVKSKKSLPKTLDDTESIQNGNDFNTKAYSLFFGTGSWYLFLRLHQILCDRLSLMLEKAKILEAEERNVKDHSKNSTAVSLHLKAKFSIPVEDYYTVLLDMIKNVLDGNMDSQTFEDTLREMFGIDAYKAFTLDKVVFNAVRQLQNLISEETSIECINMFQKEYKHNDICSSKVTKRVSAELKYQKKAEKYLAEENCIKILIYNNDGKITFELLNGESTHESRESENWSTYINKHSEDELKINAGKENDVDSRVIFLPRNVRAWHSRENSKNPEKQESYFNQNYNKNLSKYKCIFVVDRDDCLYKHQSLYNARCSHQKVTKRLGNKFFIWHKKWALLHISAKQYDATHNWLMGKAPDAMPNKTVLINDNPLDRPPYHSYNRYKVLNAADTNTM